MPQNHSSSEAKEATGDLPDHPLGNTVPPLALVKGSESNTDENAKKRLRALVPNGNHCLLTQTDSNTNEAAHVLGETIDLSKVRLSNLPCRLRILN